MTKTNDKTTLFLSAFDAHSMMIGTVFVQRTKSMHIDCNRTGPDDYAALAGSRLRERVRSVESVGLHSAGR
jgi:hypothetical protein